MREGIRKPFLFGIGKTGNSGFALVLAFFSLFIFLPAVYVLGYLGNPSLLADPLILKALFSSLSIALVVTLFNFALGVPLAWMVVRSRNGLLRWIDNLIDLSLVMPTAALGFSVYFYYGTSLGLSGLLGIEDGLVSKGPFLVILLHIVFTLPYMVRSVSAAILQMDAELEEAAQSLGAGAFAFFRTVAFPLCRQGAINGCILSFTRSLSETGATMMVAGAFSTAPVLVVSLKNSGDVQAAAMLSIALILISLSILFVARARLGAKNFSLSWAYPRLENNLSKLEMPRNFLLVLFYFFFILLPTVYLVLYYFFHFQLVDPGALFGSLAVSLFIASCVTLAGAVFALPLSYMIARNRFGLGSVLQGLNETILIVPTSALGLSLALFWTNIFSSEIIVLVLAHLCFTFPFFVKPLVTAFENISFDQEEAASSFGATPSATFRTVLLPQIKPALITGAIMAFMRSISETGATLAVSRDIKTVSVLIVELFSADRLAEAALACIVLFSFSLAFLFFLKKFQAGKAYYK